MYVCREGALMSAAGMVQMQRLESGPVAEEERLTEMSSSCQNPLSFNKGYLR